MHIIIVGCGRVGSALADAGSRGGEDVVVMGAGLVGLLAMQLARIAGAHPVIAVDLSPSRLELALRTGADLAINPRTEDLVRTVRECVGGDGAHCTIEAVGNPAVLQQCMSVCAPGARVVVMGAIVGKVTLDLYSEFVFRELTLIGSQQPRNPVVDSIYYHETGQANRTALLDMISRGTLKVHDLITHRYSWRKAPEVYRALGEAKNADYDGSGDVHRDMVGVLFDLTR
jgi:threonine dehydrogenase-like Zn-dependent dehydrogenase